MILKEFFTAGEQGLEQQKNYNAEDDKFIEEQNEIIEERLRCLLDGIITKKEVMYDVTDSFFKIFARGANKS